MAMPFDLLVFGQITQDILSTPYLNMKRLGGISYAASAATRLGLRVGLLGCVSAAMEAESRAEFQRRGIDTEGLLAKVQPPIIYEISGADELLGQQTRRQGPDAWDLALPENIPSVYQGAKMALIYPVWLPAAVAIGRQLKASGTRLAADFQHDVETLADAADLLELCDYVFLNADSLLRMTDTDLVESGLGVLRHETGGETTIVVKMGIGGSIVCPPATTNTIEVPAFLSDFQLTVGAGDAYDAAFLTTILQADSDETDTLRQAGYTASKVAAAVVESTAHDPSAVLSASLEDSGFLDGRHPVFLTPERAARFQVYVAGHFHSAPLRLLIEQAAEAVEHLGMRAFVPHRDVGLVGSGGLTPPRAYQGDIDGLRQSQAIVAVLDGASRGGTFVEIGMAIERGMPIIAICTDRTLPLSNMILGACSDIVPDVKGIVNPLMLYLAFYQENL